METFEVSKKVLSFGPTYEVRAPGSADLVAVIKGAMTSRKLTLHEGTAEGPEVATIGPNLLSTKWEIVTAKKETVAVLVFPAIAIKKSFTLQLAGKEYRADGGYLGLGFRCNDLENQPLLEVTWEVGWTERFLLKVAAPLTRDIGALATAAIHQKFYVS